LPRLQPVLLKIPVAGRPVDMRRTLRKSLLYLVAAAAVFMLAAALVTWRYSDRIKTLVLQEINVRLDAEVNVEGMKFSILRHFPYASVNCTGLTVTRPAGFPEDTLLQAARFSLLFRLTDLWTGRLHLEKARIRDGRLSLHTDRQGRHNYTILKQGDSNAGSDSLDLHLGNIGLAALAVSYTDERSGQDHRFVVDDGTLEALFSDDRVTLTAALDLDVRRIHADGVDWLTDSRADVSMRMSIHGDTVSFTGSRVAVNGLDATLDGTIVSGEGFADYALTVTTGETELKQVLALWPGRGRWKNHSVHGAARLTLAVRGRAGGGHTPLVDLAFSTSGASIRPQDSNLELKDIRLTGRYLSRKDDSRPVAWLSLKDIRARLQGRELRGAVEVEDFHDPLVHAEADADADLQALSRFFLPDTIESIAGNMRLAGTTFTGKLGRPASYVSSGSVTWANGALKVRGKPNAIRSVEGKLRLERNNLAVESLSGKVGGSDFAFTGTLTNLLGFLFEPGQKLDMKLALHSAHLNLNEILERDTTTSRADTVYRIRFADNMSFTVQAAVDRFRFNRFEASNVRGTVHLRQDELYTEALAFDAMDGHADLSGSIRETAGDSLAMQYRADVTGLDITKLFFEMGNFGQGEITDRNLRGQVTARVTFDSRWSNTLSCNTSSVRAGADLVIENGALVGYAPMQALSKFVKGADLNDIRFSTLRNTVRIENRQVFIPSMDIASSAMDIGISGTHSFDNMVDYKLQLLLSQLLGKKVKNLNTEFGTIEEDNLGKTRLFIAMKGPASNPKFTYDAKGVRQKIAEDIRKEKQTLKQILKEEFGKKDGEGPEAKKETRKQEELQIEEEEEEMNN